MLRFYATNLGYQDVNTTFFYCHSRYTNRFPYNSVFSDILLLQECQIYFVVSHIISTYYLTVLLNATDIYRVLYNDSFSIFNFYWGEVQNIKAANYWTKMHENLSFDIFRYIFALNKCGVQFFHVWWKMYTAIVSMIGWISV